MPGPLSAASQNAAQAASAAEAGAAAAPRLTLLVVDDEAEVRDALAAGLQALGYTVATAGNVPDALACLAQDSSIGALITDIRMPGRSGLELLAELAATRGDDTALEVVMISVHGTVEHAAHAMRHGAIDFLPKPFTLQQAADAAARALDRAAARRKVAAERHEQGQALVAARAETKAMAARLAEALESTAIEQPAGQALDRARVLSHELRTPLVPVLGFGELLRDHTLNADTVREYGREITAGAHRLLGTINRLLEAERLADPGLRANRSPEPAGMLAAAAVAEVQPKAAAKQVGILTRIPPGLVLPCERTLMLRALVELLDNAVAHSPAGTEVTLSMAFDGQDCRVEVADHGPGWPAAVLAAPGSLMGGGESALTRQREGLGLGLMMARRIVEAHRGALLLLVPQAGGSLAVLRWPGA